MAGGCSAANQAAEPGASGSEGTEGGVEVGLEMEKLLESHQFHRLNDPGVADDQELQPLTIAELGELHQNAQAGGIDEIDPAQIDHERLGSAGEVITDKGEKLLVGIGVKLAGKAEQHAAVLLLKAAAQGDGQSLQISDGS